MRQNYISPKGTTRSRVIVILLFSTPFYTRYSPCVCPVSASKCGVEARPAQYMLKGRDLLVLYSSLGLVFPLPPSPKFDAPWSFCFVDCIPLFFMFVMFSPFPAKRDALMSFVSLIVYLSEWMLCVPSGVTLSFCNHTYFQPPVMHLLPSLLFCCSRVFSPKLPLPR